MDNLTFLQSLDQESLYCLWAYARGFEMVFDPQITGPLVEAGWIDREGYVLPQYRNFVLSSIKQEGGKYTVIG